MKRIPDANIVGEWATGLFAQDAEDLLTSCIEAIQRIKTIYLNSDSPHMLEIEEIVTRHTPDTDPDVISSDLERLFSLLNALAPYGHYWGVKDSGDQKKIGYWPT